MAKTKNPGIEKIRKQIKKAQKRQRKMQEIVAERNYQSIDESVEDAWLRFLH